MFSPKLKGPWRGILKLLIESLILEKMFVIVTCPKFWQSCRKEVLDKHHFLDLTKINLRDQKQEKNAQERIERSIEICSSIRIFQF